MSLGEADTRAKLIDPALHRAGWIEDYIKREETAGGVEIIAGKPRRRPRGRVDYILRVMVNPNTQPVALALIEAKAEALPPGQGMEQAKCYADAKRLNVPFIFASNGHLFVEFDRFTGLTSQPKQLTDFPTPADLRQRYERGMGFSLWDPAAAPLLSRYPGGEATRRYYQDAAIRAVIEKIIQCEKNGQPKRALLSLATGAGKTFIAVHLLKRYADTGQLRRALFVCDRDELRAQGLGALNNIFGSDAAEVRRNPDGRNNAHNARIHVATYQTLNVATDDDTGNFLIEHYPENYFSHIVIDECHRSAWGKWSQLLTRNPNAVQVGLTATPRQIVITEKGKEAEIDAQISADNVRHFGEPVYEYDMAQGIEDGYLAACEIQKGRVNIDDTGITIEQILALKPVDATTGQPISAEDLKALYAKTEFEDSILLPDRVHAMCRDFFNYMMETGGPEQKTIIFCVRDRHADDVATVMNNLYAEWCRQDGRKRFDPYAFKCTASVDGSQYLSDLRGASRSHFVATTVELLTTGVDVPCVRNIVFFKYVRSPIAFYQMVGRGTRIHIPSDKLMFRVYDYTDATRLFGGEFSTRFRPTREKPEGPEPPPLPPTILVQGFEVHITDAGRYVVTNVDGKATPVTVEEYKQMLAAKLIEEAPTLQDFRDIWISPTERRDLLMHLPEAGRSVDLLRELEEMQEYDSFDVLGEAGYGMAPKTRDERADAFTYKNDNWLRGLPPGTVKATVALTAQFARGGTDELENPRIFMVPAVIQAGGLEALKVLGNPADVLTETKKRMFAA